MRGTPGNLENLWNQKSKKQFEPKKKGFVFSYKSFSGITNHTKHILH